MWITKTFVLLRTVCSFPGANNKACTYHHPDGFLLDGLLRGGRACVKQIPRGEDQRLAPVVPCEVQPDARVDENPEHRMPSRSGAARCLRATLVFAAIPCLQMLAGRHTAS